MGPVADQIAFVLLRGLIKKIREAWEKRIKAKGERKGAALLCARSSLRKLRFRFVGAPKFLILIMNFEDAQFVKPPVRRVSRARSHKQSAG